MEGIAVVRAIGLSVLLACLAGVSSAKSDKSGICQRDPHFDRRQNACATTTAPEIDSVAAVAGLTLLLGGVAILRGRAKG
jgi:hypothetical protein